MGVIHLKKPSKDFYLLLGRKTAGIWWHRGHQGPRPRAFLWAVLCPQPFFQIPSQLNRSFLLPVCLKCAPSSETLLATLFKITNYTHTYARSHACTITASLLCPHLPNLLTQHVSDLFVDHALCFPLPQAPGGLRLLPVSVTYGFQMLRAHHRCSINPSWMNG